MTTSIPIKDAWQFCPRCGTATNAEGSHPFTCTNCGYAHYFSPCTAVGALIVDAKDRMLFIVRAKDPGRGKLGFPGGFVDAYETAEDALVREIKEELNLDISKFQYLASFPNLYAFSGVIIPVTDLFFVAHVDNFDNIVVQEDEVHDWKFLAAEKVNASVLAFETHEQALAAYMSHAAD